MLFLSRASRVSQLLKPHTSGISMLFQVSSRPHAIAAVKTSGLFQKSSHGASNSFDRIRCYSSASVHPLKIKYDFEVAKISDVVGSKFTDLILDARFLVDVKMWLRVIDHENNHLLGVLEIHRCDRCDGQHVPLNLLHCLKLKGCMDLKVGQFVIVDRHDGVPVGRATLGRVINPLGEPMDGQGDIKSEKFVSLYCDPPPVLVKAKEEVLFTGIKLIDLLTPFRKGGNIGLFGDRNSINALTYELINNFKRVYGVSVYADEGGDLENHDLYHGMIKNGIISLGFKQADSKCALVYNPGSEFHEACSALVDLTAFTLAKQFCDVELLDVLLFRHTKRQVHKWISDTSSADMNVPHASATRNSVTCISIYDDEYYTDGVPHLDGAINLLAEDARPGIFPAIEHFTSMSSILSKKYVGVEHLRIANRVKKLLAHYKQLQSLPEGKSKERAFKNHSTSMARARKVINFLTQPPGIFVNRDDCLKGFAAILEGDYDKTPEEYFLMIEKVEDTWYGRKLFYS